MPLVMPYRNTHVLYVSSSTRCLTRALRTTQPEARRVLQSRALWWWSRHGSWSSCNDESVEDKMHKYQKVMRYRYSRALRRRATWDRENSPPQWALRRPGKWLSRPWGRMPLSTTEQMQARLKDEDTGFSVHDKPWEEAHRDFESFKAAVDQAIARDPVGFLFGRRLQGPLSSNNSSWTSIARMFDSKESQDSFEAKESTQHGAKKIKIENLDAPEKSATASTSPKDALPDRKQTSHQESYVYDPISGRKVQITQPEAAKPASTRTSFLSELFSEHGAEATPSPSTPKKSSKPLSTKFENSRSYEYRTLRAATIGNSIETTVEYGSKWTQPAIPQSENAAFHDRSTSAVIDEDPPFAGTTYEHSHGANASLATSHGSWLQREGFQSHGLPESIAPPRETASSTNSRLQPSLDRVHAADQPVEKRFVKRLQPAIDRVDPVRNGKEQKSTRSAPLSMVKPSAANATAKQQLIERDDLKPDMREDFDLLRPSDVRAATKSLRVTKTEADQAKLDARAQLEADYARRARDGPQEYPRDDTSKPLSRLSRALMHSSRDSINRHVQNFPDGIVAKTVTSLSAYNENFKLYITPKQSGTDLHAKIETLPGALDDLPSIFKNRQKQPISAVPVEPSDEVRAYEKEKEDTTRALQQANEQHAEAIAEGRRHLTQLVDTLREIYESERSSSQTEGLADTFQSPPTSTNTTDDLRPLRTATVKPGVKRWPHVERYTQEFEPRLVELRDQAKMVKRSLYEVKSALQEVQKARAAQIGSVPSIAVYEPMEADISSKQDSSSAPPISHRKLATHEKQRLEAMRTLNSRLKKEPNLMEKPMLQLHKSDESTLIDDNFTAPTISNSGNVRSTPQSPYVLLTYNRQSGEVDSTYLDTLMGQQATMGDKVNPIVVMGNLNYPAAFVSHFVTLENSGYSLVSGGGDLLIFQNDGTGKSKDTATNSTLASIEEMKVNIAELRNKIALEESESQPLPQPSASSSSSGALPTAAVLDKIPDAVPSPGLTMPNAPPSTSAISASHIANVVPKKKDRRLHKVRRQEHVFSGTIRPSKARSMPLDSPPVTTGSRQDQSQSSTAEQTGFVLGALRILRTAALATVGLGGAAYTIGVVTEGVGAHAQANRHEPDANEAGPRKRLVMPVGQRPGIYSTESSRAE